MYLAELRGKLSRENENREDILTSNVFSFFKYADRDIFLRGFLRLLEMEVTSEDARTAEFRFWPRLDDRTEPDLVIIVGGYYLLIEAKYLSGFADETEDLRHQLIREIEGGESEAESLGLEFGLVVVTAEHYYRPEEYSYVPANKRSLFHWINWQSIALAIYRILESGVHMSTETRMFAEDLYSLLLRKNLRGFAGLQILSQARELPDCPSDVFFQANTAAYRGSFIGFSSSLDIGGQLGEAPKRLFFLESGRFFQRLAPVADAVRVPDSPLFYARGD